MGNGKGANTTPATEGHCVNLRSARQLRYLALAVPSFTVLWNFCIKYSPERTGGYLGDSPGARQVGMQAISASQLG